MQMVIEMSWAKFLWPNGYVVLTYRALLVIINYRVIQLAFVKIPNPFKN